MIHGLDQRTEALANADGETCTCSSQVSTRYHGSHSTRQEIFKIGVRTSVAHAALNLEIRATSAVHLWLDEAILQG